MTAICCSARFPLLSVSFSYRHLSCGGMSLAHHQTLYFWKCSSPWACKQQQERTSPHLCYLCTFSTKSGPQATVDTSALEEASKHYSWWEDVPVWHCRPMFGSPVWHSVTYQSVFLNLDMVLFFTQGKDKETILAAADSTLPQLQSVYSIANMSHTGDRQQTNITTCCHEENCTVIEHTWINPFKIAEKTTNKAVSDRNKIKIL